MNPSVIITGASSGIGRALAWEYAKQGYNLGLCARRETKLQQLSAEISAKYPQVTCHWQSLDVADLTQVPLVINALSERLTRVDIVIANAGIVGVRRTGSGDLSNDLQVYQVNLFGAIATIDAAVAIFKQQKFGQIVGVSSFSAFRGIPGSAAYSSSKAALSNYLQAVDTELHGRNISVTCIHPGFIRTNLADNMEKYPFTVSAEQAARAFYKAIAQKKANVTLPTWPWALLKHLMPILPKKVMKQLF